MNEDLVKILFGRKIKRLRHNMNLTQFALGELANINQRQVTLIESGKSFPSLKTIIKFADVFSCNIYDLFIFDNHQDIDVLRENIDKTIAEFSPEQIRALYTIVKELI